MAIVIVITVLIMVYKVYVDIVNVNVGRRWSRQGRLDTEIDFEILFTYAGVGLGLLLLLVG